ncbi:MAG: hypothetical protein A2521_00510 [Deltaproteobacteria bacterium RIFOXYD12_FULL_57_12]|nr:MAG: hypothetical protein A2521_00510 [Deltaproteobacteria bacterium RIFOXYD12_FULL_57_12]
MSALSSDKLIVELNFRDRIIDERRGRPRAFDSRRMFGLLSETVVDKRTLEMVEIHELYQALNHTVTMVGAARLFHSLTTPSESLELIHARQEAFLELDANDRLRSAVQEYLGAFSRGEVELFQLLNAHYQPWMPYRPLRGAVRAVDTMVKAAAAIPRPETIYLDSLIQLILNFAKSPVSDLVRRPTYRTFGGIKTGREKSLLTPALRFRAGRLSGGTIGLALPSLLAGGAWLTGLLNPALAESLVLLTSGGVLLGMFYGFLLKPFVDNESAILPIRRRFLESNRFASAVEAVAGLDELLSFQEFQRSIPHAMVLPEMFDGERHFFEAVDMKNPILAKNNKEYVASNANLNGQGVTFITGPNSGGKTTFCKTVVQSQILGQIGAPVVASRARMNIADRIFYQAPAFDSLSDPEGRFGTELRTTRDIFYGTTPKSLVVLDEIAEGTTSHERLTLSAAILHGLFAKCNTNLLVTHAYELAEIFEAERLGQFIQVEFRNDLPTHRLVAGISRESHANRVAAKIGFAPEDILRHLKEKGYV